MSDRVVLEDHPDQTGPQTQQSHKPPPIALEEPPEHTGPTPEEALAASRKAVNDAQLARAAAESNAQQATAELNRVRSTQRDDQAAVLASAVEASTAERDRCASAWQAAMEAGDFKVAAELNKQLGMASAKLDRASGELAMLQESAKRGGGQQQEPQQGVPARSQQWINAHPEFNTHRQALLAKHAELITDGVMVESPRYFRELDAEYDRLTGAGSRQQESRDMPTPPRQQQFDGGAPSRGNGTGGASGRTVNTLLGPVSVRRSNGQDIMSITPNLRPRFEEGAKDCGMKLDEYVWDQVQIAREREAGGTGGLILEEGRTFR